MPLHPLAARFSGIAEAYERHRPRHPPALAERVVAEFGLAAGDPVLDLAAGTGRVARVLLAAGLDVQAVEPIERLRAILTTVVGPDRAHDGTAEAIPFGDGAFAAVAVGDAFHWFDQARALAEIRRVLRPGGGLALIAALPRLPGDLAALVDAARRDHPYFDGPEWLTTLRDAPGWSAARRAEVGDRQVLDLPAYVGTFSWVAALDEGPRTALLGRVRALAPEPAELDVTFALTLAARD